MGRKTLDVVLAFDGWPYEKQVHVLSTTLEAIPERLADKLPSIVAPLRKC